MYSILVSCNDGYHWHYDNNVYAKGYVFFQGVLIPAIDFYNQKKRDLENILPEVDGHFIIIDKNETECIIITDKSNSFPIYIDKDKKVIFDGWRWDSTWSFSRSDCQDFLSTSRCLPGKTIIQNIITSQHSSIYKVKNVSIETKKYFKFKHFETPRENFFENTYSYVNEYCKLASLIIVPLSGGYDSRLILNILSELNIKNVITYYVGSLDYKSCDISHKLANHHGYKWLCQEYNNRYWIKKFNSERRKAYSKYGGGLHSIAHHLDWPILDDQLSKITEDKIYLSGMGGDFIAGSLYDENLNNSETRIFQKEMYEILVRNKIYEPQKSRYMEIFENIFLNSTDMNLTFENFLYEHRYANGIFNAGKAYEFFSNSKWAYPLVNSKFIKSMFSLSPYERSHRREFIRIFNKKYSSSIRVQTRNHLPSGLYREIKKYFYKTVFSPYFFVGKLEFLGFILRNCKYQNSISSLIELHEKGFSNAKVHQ